MLRRSLTPLLALALLFAACGDDDATTDASPTTTESPDTPDEAVDADGSADDDTTGDDATSEDEPTTDADDAPAPDEPGPYAVGRRTEQVVDPSRDDRMLTVEVWYPAAAAGAPTPYELIPGVAFDADLSTVDAEPSTDGPFPLVVFSHGSGGLRQQSSSIVETLASHGFVVVAPDHVGNTAIDQLLGTATDFDVSARNRVLDVGFLIDRVEAGELAAGLADTDDLAVMGHSFGGFTALAVAGGFTDIPADPRIDAIVPLAPASSAVTDDALASIEIPVLIITGTADETTPIEDQSTRPLALVSGPATLVEIEGGSHAVVTDICDIVDAVSAPGVEVPEGTVEAAQSLAGTTCDATAGIEVQQAFDIAERYAVSFLRLHLTGDDRYADIEPIAGATVRP